MLLSFFRLIYTVYFILIVLGTYFFFSAIILPVYPFLGEKRFLSYRFFAKLWGATSLFLTGLYPKKTGRIPKSKEAKLYVLNHQSQIDILIALAILPSGFLFIAKEDLFKAPLLGWSMKLAGYIPIKRANARQSNKTLQQVQSLVKSGMSVLIYPEGTRSMDGSIGKVKRGSIMLAFQTKTPLLPVIINPAYKIMPKKSLLMSYHRLRCIIGEPLAFDWNDQSRDYTIHAAKTVEDTFKTMLQEIA